MITILLQKILEQIKALKTNIENFKNMVNVYSTTETVSGKWIDNRKVYRKVLYVETVPNGSPYNLNHGITNLDLIINCRGSYNYANQKTFIGGMMESGIWLSNFYYDSTKICFYAQGYTNKRTNMYVIIDYVKNEN